MKSFNEFIKRRIVIKQAPQISRANDLINESARKEKSLRERIDKIGLKEENANDIIEDCYGVLMPLLRAKMLLDGYNASGYSAHEAEVAYLKELGFSDNDMEFMDKLRYFRNGILYYGKKGDSEYAQHVLNFMAKTYKNLGCIIEKR